MTYQKNPYTTRLEFIANLKVRNDPQVVRKTGIICTIGPKTNTIEMMRALRDAGMCVVRMNFSHGTHEYHGSVIKTAREAFSDNKGRPVAIALDTKGPEIRTGLVQGDEIPFVQGHEMVFSTDEKYKEIGNAETLYIDYKNLPKVVEPGKIVYIDDGTMCFVVKEVLSNGVRVVAQNAGKLASRKGVNLPNTVTDLPALSEQDKRDLVFGVEQGVDMVFASFIRKGEDVRQIRATLGEKGKRIKIISKIETWDGIDNFPEILAESDGIMVARGDLGIELPPEKVTVAQKMMIAQCNIAGKPVICATQMLESMHFNPRPTRAEGSDVENAVLDGADCVMLSGETAKGMYPLEAVKTMSRLCREAEQVVFYTSVFNEIRAVTSRPTDTSEAAASSAVNAALEQEARAIMVLTTTGDTAQLVAKYRPDVPIFCITRDAQTARQAQLCRGVFPLYYSKTATESAKKSAEEWQEDVDSRLYWGMREAVRMNLLKTGDKVVCLQGWKGGHGNTNTLRIIDVEANLDELIAHPHEAQMNKRMKH